MIHTVIKIMLELNQKTQENNLEFSFFNNELFGVHFTLISFFILHKIIY